MSAPQVFDHIRWRRVNNTAHRRTRPNVAGARFPLRGQPEDHARTLRDLSQGLLRDREMARNNAGIDPSRLVALEFNFVETGQRDYLNRLGIQVLEEKEQRRALDRPIFTVPLKFETAEELREFINTRVPTINGIASVENVRASNGTPHNKRIVLQFNAKDPAKQFIQDNQNQNFECSRSPNKKSYETIVKIVGQFDDGASIEKFNAELAAYQTGSQEPSHLTARQRRDLFDALDSMADIGSGERTGPRLLQNGLPTGDEVSFFDVDLWYPGQQLLAEAIQQFRTVVASAGGRITDPPTPVAQSMLLARVQGNRRLLDALLNYDRISLVDLPPQQPVYEFSIFDNIQVPETIPTLGPDSPIACLIDSGIIAGHPLLRGVVLDERDFDSGEGTTADTVGHGTHVAGVIAYGDVSRCLSENNWSPQVRLLSAKVMRRSPFGDAVFSEETRIETQIRNAIESFVNDHQCRIFNLSFGNLSQPYRGGRQLPWAQMIDEVSRNLDVVCVVSTGNVSIPDIPQNLNQEAFQLSVRDQLLSTSHAIIDPASSLLALTVGSLSANDRAAEEELHPQRRAPIVAAPADAPSPFTRTGIVAGEGPAPNRAVKPDLVAYGGNYSLNYANTWSRQNARLGIPSLRYDFQGERLLSVASGTSVAAPYITHCCALVEASLRRTLPQIPSANLIRCLTVHSASVPEITKTWMEKNVPEQDVEGNLLRTVGYGLPSPSRAMYSADNRVTLIGEEIIQENYFHLYELEVPEEFIRERGIRSLKVTLAYDPPTRGTRKEYLGRTMWFQVYKGLTNQYLFEAMSRAEGSGEAPKIPSRFCVKSRPTYTNLQWSTVQSASFETNRTDTLDYRANENSSPILHVLVGCTLRFACEAAETQRYALAASLEHSNATVRLHQTIRTRVEQRNRVNWPG